MTVSFAHGGIPIARSTAHKASYMPASSRRRGALIPWEAAAGASEKIKGSIWLYNAHVLGLRGSRPSSGVPNDSVCLSLGVCLVAVSADTLLYCWRVISPALGA